MEKAGAKSVGFMLSQGRGGRNRERRAKVPPVSPTTLEVRPGHNRRANQSGRKLRSHNPRGPTGGPTGHG